MKRAYITTLIATTAFTLSLSFAFAQPLKVQPSANSVVSVQNGPILIRDSRASMNGGGGGYNKGSCWKACFDEYNNCVDRTAKSACVPQMKFCLAVCDSLSGGG